jgi:DNA integrity scanning protein DisA with diadenylate cyclase activity
MAFTSCKQIRYALPTFASSLPPLPDRGDALPRATGARHMTALLASRVSGIVMVGLLTQERVVSIYESGALILNEVLP